MMNRKIKERLRLAALVTLMPLVAACTSDRYDSGDGTNSYLTAETMLLRTSADGSVRSALLDDGKSVDFSNPFSAEWIEKPDTLYRALVYYDKTPSDASTTPIVRARSVAQVPVLGVMEAADVENMRTDATGFQSMWMSANGSYLNISLLLKSGKTDGSDAIQTIGIVSNGVTTDETGKRTLHLMLYHDQGGVPEYYTVQRYFSIDARSLGDADCVELTLNTYKGALTVSSSTSNS